MAPLLLFDIDQTLIRTHHAGRTSIGAAFADVFGVENAVDGMQIDGRTDHAIFAELVSTHHVRPSDPDSAIRDLAEAYLRELPPALEHRDATVLPGVTELLDALKASHPAVGLATGNMRRGAELKLRHFGLWERFGAGGFGDTTAVRAEVVAAGIEALAALLGIPADPAATIVIGDTPLDVEAARLAGAPTLGVATGRFSEAELLAAGASWAVADLTDTDRIVKILAS